MGWQARMRVRRNAGDREAGFTMVEALVTLVLFGVGTVALLQMAPRSSQFSNRGRLVSEATSLAQAKVEELHAMPSTADALTAGLHVDPAGTLPGHYERRWQITSDNPVAGMTRVEVRVRFPTQSADSVAVVVTYF